MSVLYVAEVGSTHKGDVSLACEIIRQVAHAGASIVKFQFGWNEQVENRLGLKANPVRYLDDDFVKRIASHADRCGIELMASIWSEKGIEQARSVGMKRYKIAHQMSDNVILVDTVEKDNKEIFISNGVPYKQGILRKSIWCSSAYPAYPEDLRDMPEQFGAIYGYSDHSHGLGACLLAVARGANYIEKHVALDKSDLTVRDTSFSATPDEFGLLVRMGKEIEMWR